MDWQFAIALTIVVMCCVVLFRRAVGLFRGQQSGCLGCPRNSQTDETATRALPLAQIQFKPRDR